MKFKSIQKKAIVSLTRLDCFRAENLLVTSETLGVSFKIQARLPAIMSFLILEVDGFGLSVQP